MTKKKARQTNLQAPARPIASPSAPSSSSPRGAWWLLIPIGIIAIVIGGWWLLNNRSTPKVSTIIDPSLPIGGVGACGTIPRFASKVGFNGGVNFSTSQRQIEGMIMFDPAAPPDPRTGTTHFYQHPSWSAAGNLGPIATDENGNLYVAPVPHVNVLDNPASDQMRIYRVDTNTGLMNIMLTVPATGSPSGENPFGVLGLTYDCETHSLYASSVAGSTRNNEVGRLFHIDLNTRTVLSEFDNVDALGLGIFKGSTGKRLYYGSTRAPEIRSVALDAKGDFIGTPRVEFSIGAVARDANDTARRITFAANNDMNITGVEFDYNLIAPSLHVTTHYLFSYDPATDTWNFESLAPD